jgi:hypothetical protein
MSPSDKAIKSFGEGVAEKKRRNQACLVCFFEARGRLSPQNPYNEINHSFFFIGLIISIILFLDFMILNKLSLQ